jgi:hypothetical protein
MNRAMTTAIKTAIDTCRTLDLDALEGMSSDVTRLRGELARINSEIASVSATLASEKAALDARSSSQAATPTRRAVSGLGNSPRSGTNCSGTKKKSSPMRRS